MFFLGRWGCASTGVQPAEQAGTRSTLSMLSTVETLVSQLIVSQMDCQSLSTVRGFSDVLSVCLFPLFLCLPLLHDVIPSPLFRHL